MHPAIDRIRGRETEDVLKFSNCEPLLLTFQSDSMPSLFGIDCHSAVFCHFTSPAVFLPVYCSQAKKQAYRLGTVRSKVYHKFIESIITSAIMPYHTFDHMNKYDRLLIFNHLTHQAAYMPLYQLGSP